MRWWCIEDEWNILISPEDRRMWGLAEERRWWWVHVGYSPCRLSEDAPS